jgi:hypothetical protein
MLILLKVICVAIVVGLLALPLWFPGAGDGILGEVAAVGPIGAVIATAVFFSLVALYCRSLQRILSLVKPEARAASPRSVWLMFAIPYNFVEDFFIVSNVGRSLRSDGRFGVRRSQWWLALGFTWAALQIVSLLPGDVGLVGGGLALAAWGVHWVSTVRAIRVLRAPALVGHAASSV